MKIVFLTPTHESQARGNRVTVNRWAHGLKERGHSVTVIENHDKHRLEELAPDVLHAHHAVHCGPTAVETAGSLHSAALVVSLGGTDLHCDRPSSGSPTDLAPEARRSLTGADAVVGPFAQDGEKLRTLLPDSAPFHVVPRGVSLNPSAAPPRLEKPLHGVVLGGIRPVKGQLDALRWQEELEKSGVRIRLSFAGPVIDTFYGRAFNDACQAAKHARWLGILDPPDAAGLIKEADFLINSSHSEGASNAILEALASGRPVCARRAPGNREMLEQAPPGAAHLIDDDESGLRALATWLETLAISDAESIYTQTREFVIRHYDAESELEALLEVYQQIIKD